MKKIVIIDHEPYSQRRKDLFFIQNFIESDFDLQVWDISQYVFKGIHVNGNLEGEEYVHKLDCLKQIESLLEITDIKNTVFWMECGSSWETRKLYRLLSYYNCYMIRIDLYGNTILSESEFSKFKRLFSKSFGRIIKGKINIVLYLIYKKLFHIKSVNKYLSSSLISNRTDKINHPDYEKFKFKHNQPILDKDYIVFCDNYFPYHPDLRSFNKCRNLPDGHAYQATLRCYFDYLESYYGMPVVIAAHPKSDYKGDEFGDRKIIMNQTCSLVLYANKVILHASNSISYAILKNKPLAFITTKDYNNIAFLKQRLYLLASSFNHKVYNLDNTPFDKIDIVPVDEELRKNYIYTYLTSEETKDKRNWDILKKVIEDIG